MRGIFQGLKILLRSIGHRLFDVQAEKTIQEANSKRGNRKIAIALQQSQGVAIIDGRVNVEGRIEP